MRAVRINEQDPVPTLLAREDQNFFASKTSAKPMPEDEAMPSMLDDDIATRDLTMDETLMDPDDLMSTNTDQRVAEISHLAGLPAPEGDG